MEPLETGGSNGTINQVDVDINMKTNSFPLWGLHMELYISVRDQRYLAEATPIVLHQLHCGESHQNLNGKMSSLTSSHQKFSKVKFSKTFSDKYF